MIKKKLKYSIVFIIFFQSVILGQFLDFGKNKVRYKEFDWYIIRTEHFDIYYYPEIKEIAEIGAKFAEESYENLKVKFNHQINQKIPLIFYNTHLHFQQTNTTPGFIPEGVGGFFEFLKGRVVIPFMGSLYQFRHVIKHELVHVFTMAKVSRLKKDYRLINEPNLPLWFIEGLAEFWSTKLDNQAEMILKDAVLNNYFVGLKKIEMIYGSFLMYKEGQKILDYLSRKYGQDKILLLLENLWKSPDFNEVFEFIFNNKIDDLDEEIVASLKKEYYPNVKEENFLIFDSKKITKEGLNTTPVYFKSKEGKFLFYLANKDGYSSIYRINLEDKALESELFIQGEKSEDLESFHLMRTNISINNEGILAFITKTGEKDALNLYDITKKEMVNQFSFKEIIEINSVNWANLDNNKIIFSAIDTKGYSDIFIFEIDKNDLFRITNDYYDDKNPIFYNDDSLIVFSSDRTEGEMSDNYNLFSLDLKNNNKIQYITYSKSNSTNPKFSFDFKTLYFLNDNNGINNIWKIDEFDPIKELHQNNYGMELFTNYLNTINDFVFTKENQFIFQSFENYGFYLYIKDNHDDTIKANKTIIKFSFPIDEKPWSVDKIRSLGEREKYQYQKEYSLDFAQSQIITNPVYGTTGGAIFSISDMLSDEQYIFYLYNNAQTTSDFLQSFNLSISKVSLEKRTNYALGVFHFSGRRYDIRESDEYFFERSYGAFGTLYYPFSEFRRIEVGVGLANSNKELYGNIINRKALLLTNSISYVYDNSLWYYTGPIDGLRYSVLFGITNDIKYSAVNFYTFMFDFRYYLRIGLKSSLATRFQFFANQGREARRYFMGGNWDLRGWNRWSIRGEKLWLTSLELRVPLIDEMMVKFPFVTLNFYGLRVAFFYDMGAAWDNDYKETLGSIGFGFRINLFGVLVLRYDMGKKIEDNFNKIQTGLFYQFFFGWDF